MQDAQFVLLFSCRPWTMTMVKAGMAAAVGSSGNNDLRGIRFESRPESPKAMVLVCRRGLDEQLVEEVLPKI